jgi:hypothetical protein
MVKLSYYRPSEFRKDKAPIISKRPAYDLDNANPTQRTLYFQGDILGKPISLTL